MHEMRMMEKKAKRHNSKSKTPLNKEIEIRREAFLREIMGSIPDIVRQQIAIASLPVESGGKDNDVIMKASNSLMDRVFGKAKESIDLNANVAFSLRNLSRLAEEEDDAPEPIEAVIADDDE